MPIWHFKFSHSSGGQLQHEVGWKPLDIAFDSAIQRAGFNAVEHGQIGIEQYFFATDRQDKLGKIFWLGDDLSHGLAFFRL